ncbi:MAG: hypothetical protein M1358_00515 [Chloroflexi bacterium]|nr:hypothetical protein [Chloroflexota bacterium]
MKPLIVLSFLSLLLVLVISCAPENRVTFVNETAEDLEFYTQSDVQNALLATRTVSAQSSLVHGIFPADYYSFRVAVTRQDGNWVFDQKYTRAELEWAQRRIIISSLETTPPPADVMVMPPLDDSQRPVSPAVVFVNETHDTLELYTKSDVETALAGMISVKAESSWETPDPRFVYGTITGVFDWLRVAATREDGEWVFDQTLSWDELRKANRRIVVSSLEPIAPPTNVRVVPREGAPPPALPKGGPR